uniref:RRM domain-containing protein n=1 Tax=Polytomella parva TaxID=51329 RepID=A0A7S0YAM3_9CHLO|mmetsp:Transcript_13620/g.24056  ORF Transcript_13620/g.24056 Transcript_13620/m.24056 type:complete len:685 (+) Transcript_13620:145-2199(+)
MDFSENSSTQYSNDSDSMVKSCRALFVKGLAKAATERHLLNVFAGFGPVVSCQIARHRSGRSAGFAIVTFAKAEDAVVAMETVENQIFLGRRMCIRWFQPNRVDSKSDEDNLCGLDASRLLSMSQFMESDQCSEQLDSQMNSNTQTLWSNTVSSWLNNHSGQQAPMLTHDTPLQDSVASMPLTNGSLNVSKVNSGFDNKLENSDCFNSPSTKSKESMDDSFNFSFFDSSPDIGRTTGQNSEESSPTNIKKSRLATKWGVLSIPDVTGPSGQSPRSICSSQSGDCSTSSSASIDFLSSKSSNGDSQDSSTFQAGFVDLLTEAPFSKQASWSNNNASDNSKAISSNWNLWNSSSFVVPPSTTNTFTASVNAPMPLPGESNLDRWNRNNGSLPESSSTDNFASNFGNIFATHDNGHNSYSASKDAGKNAFAIPLGISDSSTNATLSCKSSALNGSVNSLTLNANDCNTKDNSSRSVNQIAPPPVSPPSTVVHPMHQVNPNGGGYASMLTSTQGLNDGNANGFINVSNNNSTFTNSSNNNPIMAMLFPPSCSSQQYPSTSMMASQVNNSNYMVHNNSCNNVVGNNNSSHNIGIPSMNFMADMINSTYSAQQQYANALAMMVEAQKKLLEAAASINYQTSGMKSASGMVHHQLSNSAQQLGSAACQLPSAFPTHLTSMPIMYPCITHSR